MKIQDWCILTPQLGLDTGQSITLAPGTEKAGGVGWGRDELVLLGNQEVTKQGAHYANASGSLLEI